MIGEKSSLELISEVQRTLERLGYPVKVSWAEPEEGADLGLQVVVFSKKSWNLEREITHHILKVLDKYGFIPSIYWKWSS